MLRFRRDPAPLLSQKIGTAVSRCGLVFSFEERVHEIKEVSDREGSDLIAVAFRYADWVAGKEGTKTVGNKTKPQFLIPILLTLLARDSPLWINESTITLLANIINWWIWMRKGI
ncbi:unnamed protein product [Linum trigynum]|uniref:Uncharacterized protein n=1 Tax=Linum trigynum TaxID=586398 RepID=A0AAV2D368_9ROSI